MGLSYQNVRGVELLPVWKKFKSMHVDNLRHIYYAVKQLRAEGFNLKLQDVILYAVIYDAVIIDTNRPRPTHVTYITAECIRLNIYPGRAETYRAIKRLKDKGYISYMAADKSDYVTRSKVPRYTGKRIRAKTRVIITAEGYYLASRYSTIIGDMVKSRLNIPGLKPQRKPRPRIKHAPGELCKPCQITGNNIHLLNPKTKPKPITRK